MTKTIDQNELRPLTDDELGFCCHIGGGVNLNWGNVALTWVLFTVIWKVAFERAAIRGYDNAWNLMARNFPRLSRRAWATILSTVNWRGARDAANTMNNNNVPDWQLETMLEEGRFNYN